MSICGVLRNTFVHSHQINANASTEAVVFQRKESPVNAFMDQFNHCYHYDYKNS